MATNLIRRRNSILAAKVEATPGVDAWGGADGNPATDFLRGDITIALDQSQATNPEMTGSLDDAPPIAAGTKATITVSCLLRGSGDPTKPPSWGKLMPMCSYVEQVTAAAIVPTAATAGTASSVTLAAPYTATPQQYTGMPALLGGNPAGGATSLIVDQPDLNASFAHTFAPDLSAATTVSIPANIRYAPTSDPALAFTGTLIVYMDSLAYRATGCAGSWSLDIATGGAGTLKFTMVGTFAAVGPATIPPNPVVDTAQPPIYIDGIARLNGNLIRISRFSVDTGGQVIQPENPESREGFDPSLIVRRNTTGSIDPLMTVTDTVLRTQQFKDGARAPLAAGLGKFSGNRFGVVLPAVMFTANSPGDRNSLGSEAINFDSTIKEGGVYLTQY